MNFKIKLSQDQNVKIIFSQNLTKYNFKDLPIDKLFIHLQFTIIPEFNLFPLIGITLREILVHFFQLPFIFNQNLFISERSMDEVILPILRNGTSQISEFFPKQMQQIFQQICEERQIKMGNIGINNTIDINLLNSIITGDDDFVENGLKLLLKVYSQKNFWARKISEIAFKLIRNAFVSILYHSKLERIFFEFLKVIQTKETSFELFPYFPELYFVFKKACTIQPWFSNRITEFKIEINSPQSNEILAKINRKTKFLLQMNSINKYEPVNELKQDDNQLQLSKAKSVSITEKENIKGNRKQSVNIENKSGLKVKRSIPSGIILKFLESEIDIPDITKIFSEIYNKEFLKISLLESLESILKKISKPRNILYILTFLSGNNLLSQKFITEFKTISKVLSNNIRSQLFDLIPKFHEIGSNILQFIFLNSTFYPCDYIKMLFSHPIESLINHHDMHFILEYITKCFQKLPNSNKVDNTNLSRDLKNKQIISSIKSLFDILSNKNSKILNIVNIQNKIPHQFFKKFYYLSKRNQLMRFNNSNLIKRNKLINIKIQDVSANEHLNNEEIESEIEEDKTEKNSENMNNRAKKVDDSSLEQDTFRNNHSIFSGKEILQKEDNVSSLMKLLKPNDDLELLKENFQKELMKDNFSEYYKANWRDNLLRNILIVKRDNTAEKVDHYSNIKINKDNNNEEGMFMSNLFDEYAKDNIIKSAHETIINSQKEQTKKKKKQAKTKENLNKNDIKNIQPISSDNNKRNDQDLLIGGLFAEEEFYENCNVSKNEESQKIVNLKEELKEETKFHEEKKLATPFEEKQPLLEIKEEEDPFAGFNLFIEDESENNKNIQVQKETIPEKNQLNKVSLKESKTIEVI